MERKLNVDIPRSIAEFEFLIDQVLPKKLLYKLLLRGKGLNFEGYRVFGSDEDYSNIDWNASFRTNTLLARQYVEERELRIYFVVDMGENMVFGSQEKLKCEYAAELIAAFSHLMIKTGNNVGFILFNDKVFSFSSPSSDKRKYDIFIYELTNPENYKGVYNYSNILNDVNNILGKSTDLVIFVSDFIRIKKKHQEAFENIGGLFESIAICIKDPLDISLPNLNKEIVIQDFVSGEKLLINPKIARKMYEKNALEQLNLTKEIFYESNIDYLELYTNQDFKPVLADFLRRRVQKRAG